MAVPLGVNLEPLGEDMRRNYKKEVRELVRACLLATEQEEGYWLNRWDEKGWGAVNEAYSSFREWEIPEEIERWVRKNEEKVKDIIAGLFEELEKDREILEEWYREWEREEEEKEKAVLGTLVEVVKDIVK